MCAFALNDNPKLSKKVALPKMTTVFVTGSTGRAGRYIVADLIERVFDYSFEQHATGGDELHDLRIVQRRFRSGHDGFPSDHLF